MTLMVAVIAPGAVVIVVVAVVMAMVMVVVAVVMAVTAVVVAVAQVVIAVVGKKTNIFPSYAKAMVQIELETRTMRLSPRTSL